MNKIYFFIFVLGVVVMAYYAGKHHGANECKLNVVQNNLHVQSDVISIKEQINDEVVHCATGDIRRILHEKYTIAE